MCALRACPYQLGESHILQHRRLHRVLRCFFSRCHDSVSPNIATPWDSQAAEFPISCFQIRPGFGANVCHGREPWELQEHWYRGALKWHLREFWYKTLIFCWLFFTWAMKEKEAPKFVPTWFLAAAFVTTKTVRCVQLRGYILTQRFFFFGIAFEARNFSGDAWNEQWV